MKSNQALTKWESDILKPSQPAWGVFLLSDRLFGKTDKHWTYCLTVCLCLCLSVRLSCMPESYIETYSSLANCSSGLHSAAWPSTSSSQFVDLFWPNCLYVGLYLPVPLKIFALICLCFFWAHIASFLLLGLGERVHGPTPMAEECVSARIDHRLHNPPWSTLINLSNAWMCLCICVCLREREGVIERERQKGSVRDKDLIQHDLAASVCDRAEFHSGLSTNHPLFLVIWPIAYCSNLLIRRDVTFPFWLVFLFFFSIL